MSELEESPPETPSPDDFDPESADTDEEIELRAAFSEALAERGFADTLVLGCERADAVFHDRRLRIIDYLAENEPDSVRALARALDLDKGVVSRDLNELAELEVVEYVENGRASAPRLKHSHVVVEPVV
jgi:DNA-binding transcriptional ArsR family regulator